MKATPSEAKCRDMSDVCELAHKRTVRECKKKRIRVNCTDSIYCGDSGQDHGEEVEITHYTGDAQEIFDRHYDYICSVTGL